MCIHGVKTQKTRKENAISGTQNPIKKIYFKNGKVHKMQLQESRNQIEFPQFKKPRKMNRKWNKTKKYAASTTGKQVKTDHQKWSVMNVIDRL